MFFFPLLLAGGLTHVRQAGSAPTPCACACARAPRPGSGRRGLAALSRTASKPPRGRSGEAHLWPRRLTCACASRSRASRGPRASRAPCEGAAKPRRVGWPGRVRATRRFGAERAPPPRIADLELGAAWRARSPRRGSHPCGPARRGLWDPRSDSTGDSWDARCPPPGLNHARARLSARVCRLGFREHGPSRGEGQRATKRWVGSAGGVEHGPSQRGIRFEKSARNGWCLQVST